MLLLALNFSPFRAVVFATVLAFLLSFLDKRDRMGPRKVWDALVAGARGVLPIAATTPRPGIIVAVVSLTGLGLELSALIVDAAGGSLALTAIFSAIAVLIVGLAVPVTASFIIAAVIIAPALVALGVEDYAAYMFIFYYAVLSEVSPPTALSAFAAAAITGGDGFRTMMLLMRYTAPAFLVPFAFVLTENGQGLLLQGGLETILLARSPCRRSRCAASGSRSAAGCAARAAAAAAAGRRRLGGPALPRAAVDRHRPGGPRRWRSSRSSQSSPRGARIGAVTLGRVARTPLAQTSVRDALDSALIALTAAGCDTPRPRRRAAARRRDGRRPRGDRLRPRPRARARAGAALPGLRDAARAARAGRLHPRHARASARSSCSSTRAC